MSEKLKLENLSVNFNGFKAIDNINLNIYQCEIRVIIGPNGAGKTTLMDLITGKTKPTNGRIFFYDNFEMIDITGMPSYYISNLGIGRKFQGPNIFNNLTVQDNIEVALSGYNRIRNTFFFKMNRKMKNKIDDILEEINLFDKKNIFASSLSHGERQWLEIGMIFAQNPSLIILDEPTAGMTAEETFKTGEMIKTMLSENHTVIVIEHDMAFVRQVADIVTVLHQGRILAEGHLNDIEQDPNVIKVYLKEETQND